MQVAQQRCPIVGPDPVNGEKMINYSRLLILLATMLALPVQGAESGSTAGADGGEEVLDSLFEILDQETSIATHTKMNIDHVPGMVTVVHGSDAMKKGARNVFEALNFLPGVKATIQQDGIQLVIARGVGNEFASGKIKVLVNGAPFNTALNGFSNVYAMPLEQVDRIEFNHGPGSMAYGEYAFAGVLNLITRSGSDAIALRTDSSEGGMLNTAFHKSWLDGRMNLDLNLAASNTEGADIDSGEDSLYGTPGEPLSNSPGPTNEAEKVRTAFMQLAYENTRLVLQHIYRGFGDHFGLNNMLPEPDDGIKRMLTMQTAGIHHAINVDADHDIELIVGWRRFLMESDKVQLAPRGFRGQFFAEGMLGGPHYEEQEWYLDLKGDLRMGSHDLGYGMEYHEVRQGDTWVRRNYNNTPAGPVENPGGYEKFTGSENWMAEGLVRRVSSFWVQDQYNFSDKYYVAAGLRADVYDEKETVWSPRLAGVYKQDGGHIVKIQASRAYRPPTFLEQYVQNNVVVAGNADLHSEHITTYELGYIFKRASAVVRATAYMSYLRDLVDQDPATRQFVNREKADIRGIELHAGYDLARTLRLEGEFSNISAETKSRYDRLPGVPENLLDLTLSYRPSYGQQVSLHWTFTDARAREDGDPRDDLPPGRFLDITWSAASVADTGLDLIMAWRNILDQEQREPAALGAYQGDYPRQGRNWWIGLQYRN